MGATPVDLFRSGNSTSARLENVRVSGPARDVDIRIDAAGQTWVIANGRGVSTFDTPDPNWTGKVWRLPANTTYSNALVVWSDQPGHWVWQPVTDMQLPAYVTALSDVSRQFLKI